MALVMASSCTLCSILVCLPSCFHGVWLFGTPGTAARQAPLSLEFSRQAYWSGLPCPPPGESSWPRDRTTISYVRLHWQTGSLLLAPAGKPSSYLCNNWQCWSIYSLPNSVCHPTIHFLEPLLPVNPRKRTGMCMFLKYFTFQQVNLAFASNTLSKLFLQV